MPQNALLTSLESLKAPTTQMSASERLHKLFDAAWDYQMADNPEWATSVGDTRFNDRWMDRSAAAYERRKANLRLQLEALETIDRGALDTTDQLSYDLFKRDKEEDLLAAVYRPELISVSQMDGVQQEIPRALEWMPVATAKHRADFLARLEKMPQAIEQTIALLTEGLANGITQPRIAIRELPEQVANQIVNFAQEAPVLVALLKLPASLPADERARFQSDAYKLYQQKVRPAFEQFHTFLTEKYIHGCREEISWTALPHGREWYEYLVRRHTTTTMTPEEVFDVGMSEVARIRGEMQGVIESSGFKGDFAAFLKFLRTDSQFYFTDPQDLLKTYRDIAKRVDPELVRFFGHLPRLPYGVIPIPAYMEKQQTTAYYMPGSLKAGRPGYYYANTYNLPSRPKWEMEALTLHEAVPGHHLQIAIQQELDDLPEFRKQSWITAYGEGWALYSESLGEQMGFYADPYAKFGQLTYEMWRAIRLVVDPGMHAKGWSRQQAIEFFMANSSKPQHDVEVEIDRYIVWPGQALGYKIGELKIREYRRKAEAALGDRFDIRSFHDELLKYGCVPLTTLGEIIDRWIAAGGASGKAVPKEK